jgi:hypothetical protein
VTEPVEHEEEVVPRTVVAAASGTFVFPDSVAGPNATKLGVFEVRVFRPNGSFWGAIMKGEPEGSGVLDTGHSDDQNRVRVRWDYHTSTTGATSDAEVCTGAYPCFHAVARAYLAATNGDIGRQNPASNWETPTAGGFGLDRWAELATGAKAYPRDTRGGGVVSDCRAGGVTDANGNGVTGDEYDLSIASQNAKPSMDSVRRWEHGPPTHQP